MGCQSRQDGGAIGVVEGGGETFGGDAPLARGVLAQEMAGEMADDPAGNAETYTPPSRPVSGIRYTIGSSKYLTPSKRAISR